MSLKPLQWLWLAGALALAVGLVLDLAGVTDPTSLLWPALAGLLLITMGIMPRRNMAGKGRRHG